MVSLRIQSNATDRISPNRSRTHDERRLRTRPSSGHHVRHGLRLRITDLNGRYDTRAPLVIGRNVITDYHPMRRIITVPEVFTNSSNIGTARWRCKRVLSHQAFLERWTVRQAT
jgi:hypothetical protein